LNVGNIPSPTGVREDGTFEGLDEGTNSRRYSSSHAMVPYGVQPDPIVSQRVIVASAPRELAVGNNTNTLAVRRTSYGLRTSASNYARRTIEMDPTREVFTREDGTMYGPGIDRTEDVGSTAHQDDPLVEGSPSSS